MRLRSTNFKAGKVVGPEAFEEGQLSDFMGDQIDESEFRIDADAQLTTAVTMPPAPKETKKPSLSDRKELTSWFKGILGKWHMFFRFYLDFDTLRWRFSLSFR
jgi:hypothetical protein